MNGLDKEIGELKTFIADLKAERVAQKEKEKRESWTKYTSMSIVFIAVLAAIATQWAGKYSGRTLVELNNATFHQAKATDQWSYYQANSIKQNLYESIKELLPKDPGAANADAAKKRTRSRPRSPITTTARRTAEKKRRTWKSCGTMPAPLPPIPANTEAAWGLPWPFFRFPSPWVPFVWSPKRNGFGMCPFFWLPWQRLKWSWFGCIEFE